jgi:hypothetical protein
MLSTGIAKIVFFPHTALMDIKAVIDHFGGMKPFCQALNVFPQSVYQWKKRGIPLSRQYDIEVLTEGKFLADRSHLNKELLNAK